MSEPGRQELAVQSERVLLMGVVLPGGKANPMDPLDELRSLAKTAGARVVDEIVARRRQAHPATYIGSGKAQQLAMRCQQNDVDIVLFDNDLTPAQIRELEKITETKIVDRSELILHIFATHARTSQSRLQV